jgi:hypothetical protein
MMAEACIISLYDPTDQQRFPISRKTCCRYKQWPSKWWLYLEVAFGILAFNRFAVFTKDSSCRDDRWWSWHFHKSFHPCILPMGDSGVALRWASIGLRHDELSYDEWFAPMSRGHALIQKYVRVRSHLQGWPIKRSFHKLSGSTFDIPTRPIGEEDPCQNISSLRHKPTPKPKGW